MFCKRASQRNRKHSLSALSGVSAAVTPRRCGVVLFRNRKHSLSALSGVSAAVTPQSAE